MKNTNDSLNKSKEFAESLLNEGILFKGYGKIPKAVMEDPDLNIVSKAIYAYFCSYANGERMAYPCISTILRELSVTNDVYYEHRQPLIEQGYITVLKRGDTKNPHITNLYILEKAPKKHIKAINKSPSVKYKGDILALGYGRIPKSVMIDPRLDAKAKGIYAYFSAAAGKDDITSVSKKSTLYHLSIAEGTYYKYLNQLKEHDYIVPIKNNGGKFSNANFYINKYPGKDTTPKAHTNNYDKVNDLEDNNIKASESSSHKCCCHLCANQQCPNFIPRSEEGGLVKDLPDELSEPKPDLKTKTNSEMAAAQNIVPTNKDDKFTDATISHSEVCAKNPSPKLSETINNYNNHNNQIYKSVSHISHVNHNSPDAHANKTRQAEKQEINTKQLEQIREEVKKQIDYDDLEYTMGSSIKMIDGIVEILVEVAACPGGSVRIQQEEKPIGIVQSVFKKLKYEHIELVIDRFSCLTTQVKKIRAYITTMLYNSVVEHDFYYMNQVNSTYFA